MSMTGAQISIETGAEAHIQGDMAKAFVLAYKTFVSKHCPDNPPPLEYFHESFFGPAALKIFPESQGDIFTEIARTGPQGVSIEKTKNIVTSGIKHISCFRFRYSILLASDHVILPRAKSIETRKEKHRLSGHSR